MCCWPLLCGETEFVLFHRRQHAQITLHPSGVVIMDIGLNHLHKLPLAGKPSAVIAFPLQNAPEALHRAVINAVRHAGHTLRHASLHELVVKGSVRILESPVTMEQGMRVRIGFHSLIKGLENQRIVIAFAEHIGHDAPVAKVEDGAQIELVGFVSIIQLVLELFNLDLRFLQLGSGHLVFLSLSAPVLQTGLAHLLEPQRPCAYLLVAHLVLQGHLAVVFSTGQTVLDNLSTLFLRGVPSLLHAASAS